MQRFIKTNLHLLIASGVAFLCYVLLFVEFRFFQQYIRSLQSETAYLIVWNVFLTTYLILTAWLFVRIPQAKMEKRAHTVYEKKTTMVVLVLMTSIVSIVAIVREMGIGADLAGYLAAFHVCLTFYTLVVSWLFIHTLFALYYAHAYYEAENDSVYPLDFPYEDKPDYWDFVYFAFGIGATNATADISFTSKKLRRMGTFHSVLSFFFNVAVLALMIEMSASLVSR